MKVYVLSKIRGVYWWTATNELPKVPEENTDYKYTSDYSIVQQINGKKINQ